MGKSDSPKGSFADRHPRINLLLGFVLLVGLLIVAFVIVKGISTVAYRGVVKFLAYCSNLDAVILVALITGAISVLSLIISKILDYKQKEREHLAEKREEPYSAFVEMVYKVIVNKNGGGNYSQKEMDEDISKFSQKLTLWGSPKVAKKWVKFRTSGVNPQKATDNMFVLEEIMNEMRKDLGVKKMKKGS